MTFLNSAILAALTLGLLPILIHLLNRQRFKKVDFPTLRFLRELQRQKMRQVRIRQIILLALRTLAVLFLVLALARPVLKSTAGFLPGAEARTTAILILDRTASMQTETPDGSRFRQVQTRAQEILSLLKDGDDAQIIWADDPPDPFPENPTSQIHILREAVVNSTPNLRGGNLVSAIRQARQSLGKSQNLHKEVYILSDFGLSAWPEPLPDGPLLPDDVRLFLLPTDGSEPRNLSVSHADVVSRIITPNRPVEVTFTVRNTGSHAEEDRIVSVYLGGRRVAQTRVTLTAGESRTPRLKFVPDAPGDQVGYVRIEEADDFAPDDQCNFVLRVPARLTVAMVGNDGPSRTLTSLALNPASDPAAFVNVKSITPIELESSDWSDFDAIFIFDASGFSASFANRIRKFVEDGKGAFIAPGPQTDLRAYGSWFSVLGLPLPLELWQAETTPARWKNTDLQHPLFEGLFEETPDDVSPQISRMMRIVLSGSAVEIVSTSIGFPFLIESSVGRGRVLLMTGSVDPSWTTLFRNGIFPPLMVSSAAYLSGIGTSGTVYELTAGIPSQIQFAGTPGSESFELRGQQALAPVVETSSSGYVLRIPGLDNLGGYEIWQGSHRLASLAVNIPPQESEIAELPSASYQRIVGGKVTQLDQKSEIQTAVMEGRFGRELWKVCLFIALACLVAEMIIGRVGRREVAAA